MALRKIGAVVVIWPMSDLSYRITTWRHVDGEAKRDG